MNNIVLILSFACLVSGGHHPAWSAGPWSDCLKDTGAEGLFQRSVICADVFTGENLPTCNNATKPKEYKRCFCGIVMCMQSSFSFSSIAASNIEPAFRHGSHPNSSFEEIGCLANRSFHAFPSVTTLAKYDEHCKDYNGTDPCYGGLPFFNEATTDCDGFCLRMGLDISGIISGMCRCGATPLNRAVWQQSAPRTQLGLNTSDLVATADPLCFAHVRHYAGYYVADGVPVEVIDLLEQDDQYIDRIALGLVHRIDEIDDDTLRKASNVSISMDLVMSANTGANWHRQCSPYPHSCGKAGPVSQISPYVQPSPPAGVADNWDQYVMVKYLFSSDTDNTRKQSFREAADRWRLNTCINLVEQGVLSDQSSYDILVRRQPDNTGCSAYLGWRYHKEFPNQPSQINLGWCKGSAHVGNMAHEIGHVMGMNHEQKRPDATGSHYGQGPHLNLNWASIGSSWIPQWTPDSASYVGSGGVYAPYDFGSIMHYGVGPDHSTVPSGQTTGQRSKLSAGDIAQITAMYSCGTYVGPTGTRTTTTRASTTTHPPVAAPSPPPSAESSSPVGSIVGVLFALLFAALLAIGAYWYVREKRKVGAPIFGNCPDLGHSWKSLTENHDRSPTEAKVKRQDSEIIVVPQWKLYLRQWFGRGGEEAAKTDSPRAAPVGKSPATATPQKNQAAQKAAKSGKTDPGVQGNSLGKPAIKPKSGAAKKTAKAQAKNKVQTNTTKVEEPPPEKVEKSTLLQKAAGWWANRGQVANETPDSPELAAKDEVNTPLQPKPPAKPRKFKKMAKRLLGQKGTSEDANETNLSVVSPRPIAAHSQKAKKAPKKKASPPKAKASSNKSGEMASSL